MFYSRFKPTETYLKKITSIKAIENLNTNSKLINFLVDCYFDNLRLKKEIHLLKQQQATLKKAA